MTKKGGLGRGLSSLIPSKQYSDSDEQKTTSLQKEEFIVPTELRDETKGQLISEIPVEKISPSKTQPRSFFDEKALEELSISIKENGILQPIVVTKIGTDDFEIIAGERRFRAAKMAGLTEVPAIVRSVTQQQKLELSILENIQREALSPVEEARAYQRLGNEFNMTHEEIASKLGKSRSQISNMIRLLDLPARIQEALEAKQISVGHAKTIASLSDEAEQLELFKSILRNQLNVRETEKAITGIKSKNSIFKNKSFKDPNIIEKEELLRDTLSTKVNITKRGGKGKIEIIFYSEEEFNSIIDKIS